MFDETRTRLQELGYPAGDLWDLPTSDARFADGGQYRVEVPTVNSAAAARIILQGCRDAGVKVDRLDQTKGGMLFTEADLRQYVALGEEFDVEICFGVGPRGMYDIGAQKLGNSVWAHAPAYRLRGMDQMLHAVADIERIVAAGGRTILIYDEGLLLLAHKLRTSGHLPAETVLMASAHLGVNNAIGYRILQDLGADTVATQRDMELPMVASLRAAVDIPIHIHVDNPQATGGFVRIYDAPELVRIGAPIFLKMGSSVLERHGMRMSLDEAEQMVEQVVSTLEVVDRIAPDLKQSVYSRTDGRTLARSAPGDAR